MTTTPRIYVADLAAYNSGYLHGVWIDASEEVGDIQEQINAMLAASPCRMPRNTLSMITKVSTATGLANMKALKPPTKSLVSSKISRSLVPACSATSPASRKIRRVAEEDYCGSFECLADYAQQLTEETTQIPPSLAYYINYEAMARDMELGGDVFTLETGYREIHVFWNH